MAERTPAPKMRREGGAWVEVSYRDSGGRLRHEWTCGRRHPDHWARPTRSLPTLAAAADALREHLRTEHAELWEQCIRCLGSGCGVIWPHCNCCPRCNGRGYVERSAQDSHAARQEASSTPDGPEGAGSGNGAQIAGNACGDRLGAWHGPIGPCVLTGRHTLHDDGAGITWSRTNVPDLTGGAS